jgi:hypothetical protein
MLFLRNRGQAQGGSRVAMVELGVRDAEWDDRLVA